MLKCPECKQLLDHLNYVQRKPGKFKVMPWNHEWDNMPNYRGEWIEDKILDEPKYLDYYCPLCNAKIEVTDDNFEEIERKLWENKFMGEVSNAKMSKM
jgi:uncharacterized protein YbaR (Trm112 family)